MPDAGPQVALVGAGYWGKLYVRILSQQAAKKNIDFVGVYEPHLETRNAVRRAYPTLRLVESLDDFLNDGEVAAIVIATPASTHADVIEKCINAQKHVLVEKPLTLESGSSRHLVEMAHRKNTLLMVGHTFLFNEGIRELKRRMAAESFGRLHYIHCKRTNMGPIRSDTSVIWDLAPHDVSIVLYIMQERGLRLLRISAVGSKSLGSKHVDTAWIHMIFEQEVVAQLHVSWIDPHKVRDIVAVGEKERITVDDMNPRGMVSIFEGGVAIPPDGLTTNGLQYRDGDILIPKINAGEPLSDQFQQFIRSVHDPTSPNPSLGDFGCQVVEVLEAAEKSAARGGVPINIGAAALPAAGFPEVTLMPSMVDESQGPIPLVDIKAGYWRRKAEIDKSIAEVLSSGAFIEGPQLKQFEEAFGKFVGVKHCVGVNSGTDALYLAYKHLGVGPGDEIITQANTFIATCLGATTLGATIKLVDCVAGTYQMDVSKLEAAITDKTKLIVPVHLYGLAADMDAVLRVAKARGIPVVEDASQAHGVSYKGRPVGSIGDAGCFSFYPGKNLGAFGDGGALCTNDDTLAARARAWRAWGAQKKYHHTEKGGNSRLDTVQAAILLQKLETLQEGNASRRCVAQFYDKHLQGVGDLELPRAPADCEPVWHLYVIATSHRDGLLKYLNDRGIGAGIHYPIPIHKQEAYKELSSNVCPVTELYANRILSLPIFPELTEVQRQRVVQHVKDYFEKEYTKMPEAKRQKQS